MSQTINALASPSQIYQACTQNALPNDLQDSVRFHAARLTSAAGLLLRLPQDITAQANVLLFRYWLVADIMLHEFSDVSAAVLYLTAKISAQPRSPRSVANVYAYLTSLPVSMAMPCSLFAPRGAIPPDPTAYFLSEGSYHAFRAKLFHNEGLILAALGFDTQVALPHLLCMTYLQALDVLADDEARGPRVARRAVAWLNSALWSPQMLALTHQPCVLAVAAIYLAAREEGVRLCSEGVPWWEVFDVDREELGFMCVGMQSLRGVAKRDAELWAQGRTTAMLQRADVRREMKRRGLSLTTVAGKDVDEEDEMGRMLDEKVFAAASEDVQSRK